MKEFITLDIDKEPYIKVLSNDKVINLTGQSGSGKSTLATYLKDSSTDVIHLDLYFDTNDISNDFQFNTVISKYRELTNYGHFGRPDLDLPFEKLDMVDRLKEYIENIK